MISYTTPLCLSLFGLLIGLVAARWYLVRSLSTQGKHLSQMETFIENIPVKLSGTASGITAKVSAISSAAGLGNGEGGAINGSTVTASSAAMISEIEPAQLSISQTTAPSSGTTVNQASPISLSIQALPAIPNSTETSSTSIVLADAGRAHAAHQHSGIAPLPQGGNIALSESGSISQKLTPTEIAFIIRGGDLNHALIVLVVDLIQRCVKTQDSSFSDGLSDYEKSMWRIVKRSVKDWATQKAQDTVLTTAKNPVAAMRRIIFWYNFVRNSLRGMIGDAIADPRSIKKYFSPAGVIRIIADFTSQGYKQTFSEELRKSLLRRGLLVPEPVRQKVGGKFFALGMAGLIVTLVIAFQFCPVQANALVTWFASLLAAFVGRTIIATRHLIPFYEELDVVAEQIRRKSFRLTIVRTLLRSVNAIVWLAFFFCVSVSLLLGFLYVKAMTPTAGANEIVALIAMTVANFAIADFIFNGFKLNIQECPTRIADKQLEAVRKELEHVSPIDTFRKLLSQPNYDPTFSKLLAIYGIETLLLLM